MSRFQAFLRSAGERQDLVIVFFILAVIGLMILPLPTWLMDLMIAINIAIAILFLLLAVYLKNPLEFSTLPSAMLIATLVRIAITIATSRLILLQADAGQIISGFGNFVIAGNLVVGLVIFAIIAIAQFVVITRGAERVAEVAARFALDALPGKQMSIDSDLRSGDIDRQEARSRRLNLERESQYYGAMDGAMKFVKGDAIVSMIIIFVNLIGGLIVGTVVRGMTVGDAFGTYALLTVGDGLASQIPALLVAVAGGIVVTRVPNEHSKNLGFDLARELVSSAQSLAIVAVALWTLGLMPGFPTMTFFGLGALAAAGAAALFFADRRRRLEAESAAERVAAEAAQAAAKTDVRDVQPARPGDVFTLRVGARVGSQIDMHGYREALRDRIAMATNELGITLSMPSMMTDPDLPEGDAVFDVEGAPAWRGDIPLDHVFVPDRAGLADVISESAVRAELPGLGHGAWISTEAAQQLPEGSAGPLSPSVALGTVAGTMARQWASRAFGLQEAEAWLQSMSHAGFAALVNQVRQSVALPRIADTLRHLLAEHVSLSQPRLVLEALLELSPRVDENAALADHVRLSLARPISAYYGDRERLISCIVIEFDLEEHLRQSIRETPNGLRLSLDYDTADVLASQLAGWQRGSSGSSTPLVLLTSFDIRRPVWMFTRTRSLTLPVLAFEEIASDYQVMPVGTLNLASLRGDPMAA